MSANLIALQNRFLGQGETVYDRLAQLAHDRGALRDEDLLALAKELSLPPAHVRSVAKFYDELRVEAPAKRALQVCNGESCAVAGAEGCHAHLATALGGADGVVVGEVTCLGYCGSGPNALLVEDGVKKVFSLRGEGLAAVERALLDGAAFDPVEPVNVVHAPRSDREKVLLSRFGPELTDLAAARAAGVYGALEAALKGTPQAVVDAVKASKIRGRGGAGFPAGLKLQTVKDASSKRGDKYVVVNADEGDAGAFIDKELLEQAPHSVLEGTILAAYAVGASQGFVYLRGEYPRAIGIWKKALADARAAGILGDSVLGSGFAFDVKLVEGHGAYICGEETSLLRSLEGVPAQVSPKPPYPAIHGYKAAPTVVNNVETLAAYPWIVERGGEAYAALGAGDSRGTKLLSLSGSVAKPGLYEVELGTTLRTILFELAGGVPGGKAFKAVQIGGPLGGIFGEQHLDLPLTFEALAKAGGMLGHAGIVVYDEDVDLVRIGRGLMKFCAVESCGKCFPCRIGSVRATEVFDKILAGRGTQADIDLLGEVNETMLLGSLCALGGGIPIPIKNLLTFFVSEFEAYVPGAKTPPVL
ncbi:MAG: NAD(P)H-dependent oxidoreductase subunit E [Sandaracinaceae bacterium]|nr:NAD(P)H-dependent oxidoreductase subunit E [Sandaracinaceae bacterium]